MTEQAPPPPAWFLLLAFVGGVYSASLSFRLLSYLALSMRRPRDLRRRYGAWAVVTGPTSGIGRSVALELARRGLNLVLLDLDAGNLEETSDVVVSRHGVETKTVVFDLSLVGTTQGDESMRQLRAAIEGLDVGVLVNNAGVSRPSMVYLHEADVEELVRMARVNLWGLTEVTAAVLPGMLERRRGAIVNMGSASSEAIPSFPLNTIYAATKRYVAMFSRSLHVEYRSKGIDVQCQAPFFVATRMVGSAVRDKWLSPLVPTPDDYARAATRWIGHGPLCTPTLGHQLLWCLAGILPDVAHDWLRLREHLRLRAVLQRMRAARASKEC
ncbi:hypothetical protein BDA96_10G154800 [Sorghum bicolor]|uniref:B-keto acyl reductase n=2 Tax=Sorghum bicolor TaxID=4558 RepID=C5Z937_SORBI|nr:very-long-chain 3-oxoacyl-CoA reductase 1 [Sorghum bicolor]EER88284.1 hypothetical protein SORBI_3010G124600 [Sorghum bicolor]KAG0514035.1 hypothetical protein BDA96_10G154800 [Sorghum bicolor]|eukprot:XP_002436917.1 very-long-chain 3-oxoacyl-CoA reductase 1 [Sorghum bicolor]